MPPVRPLMAMGPLHQLATVIVLVAQRAEAAKVRGQEETPAAEAEIKTKAAAAEAVRKITIGDNNRRTKVMARPRLQAMVLQPPVVTMGHRLRNLHRVRF